MKRKLLETKNHDGEVWKPLDFAPSYSVSNYGRCKHEFKNGKVYQIKPYKHNNRNYYIVHINRKEYRFSHLVWKAFNGEIPEGYRIIHLDYCIGNNDLSNLKCVPVKHAGQRTARIAKINRPVVSDALGKIFFSTRSCAKSVGISYTTVAYYCNNPDIYQNQKLKLRWATEDECRKLDDLLDRKRLRGEL